MDDAPTLNPDNRFVDYYSDQLSNDGTVVIDAVNGFESIDADKDGTADNHFLHQFINCYCGLYRLDFRGGDCQFRWNFQYRNNCSY